MALRPALLGRRAGLTRICLLLAATVAILAHLYLFSQSPAVARPTRHAWLDWLAHKQDDSWSPMRKAFAYTATDPRLPLYSYMYFDRQTKFPYPPSSLLVFFVLELPPVRHLTDLTGIAPFGMLNVLSYIALLVTSIFVVKIFLASVKGTRYDAYLTGSRPRLLLSVGIILFLTFTFYPTSMGVALGQVQTWITCAQTIMIWCWIQDKRFLGGLLAGVASLIKPHSAVLLLWAVLRRQWAFAGGFAAAALPGGLLSLWTFGLADHLDYVNYLSFISRHGEAYSGNQSINGLLHRAFSNGDSLRFASIGPYAPFHPWVYVGTMLGAALLIGTALIWPARTAGRGGVADLSIAALSSTMASPVVWAHHYGVLLPIYAFLAPSLLATAAFGRWTAPYLGASYLLTGYSLPRTNALAATPFNVLQSYLNVLQSYLVFFGPLMVLAGLYALLATGRERRVIERTGCGATPKPVQGRPPPETPPGPSKPSAALS